MQNLCTICWFYLVFKFVLVCKTHSGAVHQKLPYGGSFLRENALTWFSSSAFTPYYLSAFSIGTSQSFLFITYLFIYLFIYLVYFLFMCVYVDFKTYF